MIPGAGFPVETIEKFSVLCSDNFGVRVQHILNDQSRRDSFLQVNRSFKPHIVVFNNLHWPAGSFTDFMADRFHVLLGGVDSSVFSPIPYRSHPLSKDKWIIGGQARKNPVPIIESLQFLPSSVSLRFFGNDSFSLSQKYKTLVEDGRLVLLGPVRSDQELLDFYHSVDCIVMTETFAGWANLVAEAMASGVPVVCTPHGTSAFAFNHKTALIVENPSPELIANEILRLIDDPILCANLTKEARKVVEGFSWYSYVKDLLKIIVHDGVQHYVFSPDDDLWGKWPLSERLHGLAPLLDVTAGRSVIDFGAAEGLIAREFLKNGAGKLIGFELDMHRVEKAIKICCHWDACEFYAADLSDWTTFCRVYAEKIIRYDIVLYLGIHHHLPVENRQHILANICDLASNYIAIRTPEKFYESDGIDSLLQEKGFVRFKAVSGQRTDSNDLGVVRIYERASNNWGCDD